MPVFVFCFFTTVKKRIELNGKKVELKKAFAKGEMGGPGRMPMGMQMNGRGGKLLC